MISRLFEEKAGVYASPVLWLLPFCQRCSLSKNRRTIWAHASRSQRW